MTEYETAALAAQQAATQTAMWVSIAQAAVAFVVGAVQCGLIYAGFQIMRKNGDHRDQQHKEAMRALEALIERTAPKT